MSFKKLKVISATVAAVVGSVLSIITMSLTANESITIYAISLNPIVGGLNYVRLIMLLPIKAFVYILSGVFAIRELKEKPPFQKRTMIFLLVIESVFAVYTAFMLFVILTMYYLLNIAYFAIEVVASLIFIWLYIGLIKATVKINKIT